MDYAFLPPEINSARVYTGPGSGSMLAAAGSWDSLAAELSNTAETYGSVLSSLTALHWRGPASAAMVATAAPYMDWLSTTAQQTKQTAMQARAAAAAYEQAFAMTVPPPLITANRAQLMSLIAMNFFGQNTAAIAATEAQYAEMWAQDTAAMFGYSASSASATQLTPFSTPPQTTNTSGLTAQSSAVSKALSTPAASVQSVLSHLTSAVSSAAATPTSIFPSDFQIFNGLFICLRHGQLHPGCRFDCDLNYWSREELGHFARFRGADRGSGCARPGVKRCRRRGRPVQRGGDSERSEHDRADVSTTELGCTVDRPSLGVDAGRLDHARRERPTRAQCRRTRCARDANGRNAASLGCHPAIRDPAHRDDAPTCRWVTHPSRQAARAVRTSNCLDSYGNTPQPSVNASITPPWSRSGPGSKSNFLNTRQIGDMELAASMADYIDNFYNTERATATSVTSARQRN